MGAGRPRIILDEKMIIALASVGATNEDIADQLGVYRATIERNYAAAMKEGRARARNGLRVAQFNLAKEGHPTMLIWLGKQMLGQKDQVDVDLTATVKPIGWDNLYEEEQELPDLVGDALEASEMILEEGEE